MKKNYLLILLLFCIKLSYGQWENLNTEILDNLTGVVFYDNNGLVSGENGLYFTNNYGIGSVSWTRFEITDNTTDSSIYENTNFTHCFGNTENTTNTGTVYACGQNTVTNKAVIFKISLPSLQYNIIYEGNNNSILNKIKYNEYNDKYYAVGNNGLLVYIDDTIVTSVTTNTDDNFNTLTFNNNSVYIGRNNGIYLGTVDNQDVYNYNFFDTPNVNHKDMYHPSSGTIFSVGDNFTKFSNTQLTYYNNFDFGELNGKSIVRNGSEYFVGTDHGIFKSIFNFSDGSSYSLEWQPSSQTNTINCLWNDPLDNTIVYGCGANGALLKTNNSGGATKPYMGLDIYGSCVGSTIDLDLLKGTSNSCVWTINGSVISNDCNDFNYSFNTVGTYEISVSGENSWGEQTIVTKTINIVNPPEIDKTISISDAILCKEESIDIQIENSEINVRYTLKKDETFLDPIYGTSPTGNGGTITLTSSLINESGNYYLTAEHTLANCNRVFTEQFYIEVEKTEASFVSSLINVEQNEVVEFSETSIDAQDFSWTFSPSASPNNSSIENPEVTFATIGETIVDLEVSSTNGCVDDIQALGPYVYEELTNQESCWTLHNVGTDPGWTGHYFNDIGDLAKIQDGFLICGFYEDTVLDSYVGNTYDTSGRSGGYLAKYNNNGILKWKVHSEKYNLDERDEFFSAVEDQDGNIYVCGSSKGTFYDVKNNITELGQGSGPNYGANSKGFLIKLSAQGEFLWDIQGDNFHPLSLHIDKTNNLVVYGHSGGNNNQLYLNGNPSDIIKQVTTPTAISRVLVKFSPFGNVIWDTGYYFNSNNGPFTADIGFDNDNNLYIAGDFEYKIDLYSVGSDVPETLLRQNNDNGPRMFLAKFDENGQISWKLRSYTNGEFTDRTTARSLTVDDDGNCYITGTNDVNNTFFGSSNTHLFENTDGSTIEKNVGPFFIAKVNSDGICNWVEGISNAWYAIGRKVVKHGDELFVMGDVGTNDSTPSEVSFTSSVGDPFSITINDSDYYIAVYTLDGILKRLILNGENDGQLIDDVGNHGFIKGEGDYFYLSKNIRYFNGASNFNNFGTVISDTDGWDGIITRFTEDCGLAYNVLSVNDFSISNGLNVYPNPVSNFLNIKGSTVFESVTIYDINGRLIKNIKPTRTNLEYKLDVKELSEGMYFIEVQSGNSKQVQKFIKK